MNYIHRPSGDCVTTAIQKSVHPFSIPACSIAQGHGGLLELLLAFIATLDKSPPYYSFDSKMHF